MRLAQRLYEGVEIDGETIGLITYMRTDGIDIAPEAIADIRVMLGKNYGKEYVPASPRQYHNKSKNAQEAHEAMRPTSASRTPAEVAKYVDRDQARLYELIWNRAVASQMESAELERTTVDIAAKVRRRTIDLRATGQVVKFDGFLTLYQEGQDEAADDDESKRLPAMAEGEALAKQAIDATQHFTEPPPRFSEAALVKRMEELGIGRPSTYASILQVLQDRGYVRIDKKRLIPEDKGRVVVGFLESFFQRYVEYDFTATLEEQLDRVSNNEIDWKEVLRGLLDRLHRRGQRHQGTAHHPGARRAQRAARAAHLPGARRRRRGARNARNAAPALSLKLGRFGAFIGCSNYPECNFTRQMTPGADGSQRTKVLGEDPVTGLEVTVRGGRFGTYLQLGEQAPAVKPLKGEKAVKPRSPSAPACRKASRPTTSISTRRWRCWRCRAKSANPGRRRADHRRRRPLRTLRQARQDLRQPGGRRRRSHHRPQPRRHLIAEKKANPKKGPPLRRRSGQGARRASGQGRPDRGQERPLWTLCQPQRRQRHAAGDKTPETVTLDEAVVLLDARAARMGNSPKGRRAAGRKKASGKAVASPAAKPKKPTAAKPKKAAVAAHAKPVRRIKATAAE